MTVPTGNQITSVEVHKRDNIEVLDVPTTTVVTTTTSMTTPLVTVDTEIRGTSSPRISLPEGSLSHPTVTETCRPRTWMQKLTEGQTNEPRREEDNSSESVTSIVETLPEDIPDELGHEWRVLHPFDLPGVRYPTDAKPPNQRRLVENNALVELIQMTEYLDDVPTWGQRDYKLNPLAMVILSIEEEVEEEVEEVEEEESGSKKDASIDLMKVSEEEITRITIQELNNQLQLRDHNWLDKMMVGLHLPI